MQPAVSEEEERHVELLNSCKRAGRKLSTVTTPATCMKT